jgi:hypothetical protein
MSIPQKLNEIHSVTARLLQILLGALSPTEYRLN